MSKRFIVEAGVPVRRSLAGAGARPPPRGARLQCGDRAGDEPRPVPAAGRRRRAHDAARARHLGRDRLSARADGRRAGRAGTSSASPTGASSSASAARCASTTRSASACSWTAPVPRMREYIQTLRAIWDSWQTGTKPSFVGEHYRYTYTTPFFNPGPIEHPRIPVAISAVNPAMCRLAGELCDGVRLHSFCTRRYLDDSHPAQHRRAAPRRRARAEDVELSGGGFIATGPDDAERCSKQVERSAARSRSTARRRPTCGVLEAQRLGRARRAPEHSCRATASGTRWRAPSPTTCVHAFAAVGRYDEIVPTIRERFADVARIPLPAAARGRPRRGPRARAAAGSDGETDRHRAR